MKWAYARPRPELVPHGAEVYTASFPSGHSMMSAVVYLTLGALLARTQADRAVKAYMLAVAVIADVAGGRRAACISACTGRPMCSRDGRSAACGP